MPLATALTVLYLGAAWSIVVACCSSSLPCGFAAGGALTRPWRERLNLMPMLERSLATYYDAFHATPAGARAVAAAVSATILQEPLPSAVFPDRKGRGETTGVPGAAARAALLGRRGRSPSTGMGVLMYACALVFTVHEHGGVDG